LDYQFCPLTLPVRTFGWFVLGASLIAPGTGDPGWNGPRLWGMGVTSAETKKNFINDQYVIKLEIFIGIKPALSTLLMLKR
jgi:hypothetical protein